jgi:hypothetical protein
VAGIGFGPFVALLSLPLFASLNTPLAGSVTCTDDS